TPPPPVSTLFPYTTLFRSTACDLAYPGLLERLRQHISVRALELDLPTRKVRAALGGASLKNAYFWRLYARSVESSREPIEPIIRSEEHTSELQSLRHLVCR